MASTISALTPVAQLTGNEEVPVAYQGNNFKFKLSMIKTILSKEDVGLDKVDNTRDIDKPVSTAVQSAINAKASLNHKHAIGEVNGLSDVLDSKAETAHGHTQSDVGGLVEALANKANKDHTQPISSVNGLTAALDSKSSADHGHAVTDVSGLFDTLTTLANGLAGKAAINHAHNVADITGLRNYIEQVAGSGGTLGDVVFPVADW